MVEDILRQMKTYAKRRDIQALRGVSVLLVIFYHYNIGGFKGGFLGVDIFFVISGFVITQKIATGSGSVRAQLLSFYQSRARRILPVSLLSLLGIAIASSFLLSPLNLHQYMVEGIGVLLTIPNLIFLNQNTDYLSQSLDPSPFLHFWSLGIEEQFYLVWPLLFLLFLRKRKKAVYVLTGLSLVFALLTTYNFSEVYSFYLPTSRAWELLIGASLAVSKKTIEGAKKNLVACIGWGGVVLSVILIGSDQPTPGVSTILPVLSAGLIILADAKLSTNRFLEWLGDLSFPLYLVHWPLIVILNFRSPEPSVVSRLLLIALALGLSLFLHKFVELKFRSVRGFKKRWIGIYFALGAVAISILAVSSYSFNNSTSAIKFDLTSPAIYDNGCHLPFKESEPKSSCIFGDQTSDSKIILIGDSHGAQWFPALEEFATQTKRNLVTFTKSGCPATDLPLMRGGITDSECVKWQRALPKKLASEKPEYVIIANATQITAKVATPTNSYVNTWSAGFSSFLEKLKAQDLKVIVIGDTPYPGKNSPSCLSVHLKDPTLCDVTRTRTPSSTVTKEISLKYGASFIDPLDWICDGATCPAVRGGINVYRDNSHLSVAFTRTLVPALTDALNKVT